MAVPKLVRADIPAAEALDWRILLGLFLVLAPLLIRAASVTATLPNWDLDPLVYSLPNSTIGPGASMLVDCCVLTGAALLMLGSARTHSPGSRLSYVMCLLWAVGAVGVFLHAFVIGVGDKWFVPDIADQRIGLSWLSAISVALALAHVGSDARVRRIVVGTLLGFGVLLALRGVQQVYIEHPRVAADFLRDKTRVLAAHGWTEGSLMAKGFERRVLQPEASGYFGLANVYATLAAGFGACACVLLFGIIRSRRELKQSLGVVIALLVATVASVGGLVLSGAKGGYLAFVGGLGAAVLATLIRTGVQGDRKRRVLGVVLGLSAVFGPIALVAFRGLIGERIGELSLFFRWFYMIGAWRIFAHHPVVGVGPDGFQSAYSYLKPPLSPEDVVSPHSLLFDYLATLGIFGIAWIGLTLMIAGRVGRTASTSYPAIEENAAVDRRMWRVVLGVIAIATLIPLWVESPLIPLDTMGVRLLGAGLWAMVAWGVLRLSISEGWARLAAAAMGLAIIAQMQIDVAGTWIASTGLCFVAVGLAASLPGPSDTKSTTHGEPSDSVSHTSPRWSKLLRLGNAMAICMMALFAIALGAVPALKWERKLQSAAEYVVPVAELSARINSLTTQPQTGAASTLIVPDSPARLASDLSRLLGHRVGESAAEVQGAMIELEQRVLPRAAEELATAYAMEPGDRRTLRESSRLYLRLAEAANAQRQMESAWVQATKAIEVFGVPAQESSGTSPSLAHFRSTDWRWASLLYERRAAFAQSAEAAKSDLVAALACVETAIRLDPYNPEAPLRAFRLAQRVGDRQQAARHAQGALQTNILQRLDPGVRGLSEGDLADLRAAVAQP
jgi:tetratricopeptide (TPR) repeat protein